MPPREDDSGPGPSPLIDPKSQEKFSIPQGRGTYQLMGEIARGGMGVVLKGHDTDLGRDVALKVLHGDLAQRPEVLQRFVEEAQIGGQLQHPGIVPVYELGLMADERPYFTMKLVKGRTLATLLAERESPRSARRRMLEVFESICQTMAYAHSRGVIHRDLKPANVMVGAFGEVQVVDWGLAKVLARGGTADEKKAKEARSIHTVLETVRSSSSQAPGSGTDSLIGSVMGTPAYMPPEQAGGHVDRLDERTDVFALGAILCEILTGHPPYDSEEGEKEQTLIQAAQAELDPALERLDACQADVELVKLTKQCLLASQAVRPRNAGVLAERIHEHLETVEERAQAAQIEAAEERVRAEEARGRAEEERVHALRERKARKLTIALAVAVLAMGVIGGGGWLWVQNERAVQAREAAERESEIARREREITLGVNAALNEASLLQGRGLWSDALAAVDQASALAEAGGAGPDLVERIEVLRADLGRASDEARRIEERAQRAARFLADLDQVGQDNDTARRVFDFDAVDQEYQRVFAAHGIDVDGSEPGQVAAALAERGVGRELAPVLDRWLVVRRKLSRRQAERSQSPEDTSRALDLIEVAHHVDDDSLRADLREAMLYDDLEMLAILSESDLAAVHPSTLLLLGTALGLAGENERAATVLREGVSWHPDDYGLRLALVEHLGQSRYGSDWDPEQAQEQRRHLEAARALRPGSTGLRMRQIWALGALAADAERRGDESTSQRAHRAAVAEFEALQEETELESWERLQYARSLEGAGEPDLSLAQYRTVFASSSNQWNDESTGIAFLERGSLEDAAAAFERLVGRAPDNPLGHRMLAVVRALQLAREGRAEEAVDSLRTSFDSYAQDLAGEANNLAWRFARTPREGLLRGWRPGSSEDEERVHLALDALVHEALRLSEYSVERAPGDKNWNTLGVLRYRTGDLEGCLQALDSAMALEGGGDAFDWYFAAMAHHRLGDEERARSSFERANRWTLENMTWNNTEELRMFREEASGLLGTEGF
jgi:tetratricopeptide (TPR) repeat protein/tRNA A-37 threonylcarbamoyl transferase component Bud32